MSLTIYRLYNYLPQTLQKIIDKKWYEYLSKIDKSGHMAFMNWGYANLALDQKPLLLNIEDEPNRYCIQLYDHVIGALDLSNLDILDVGCGRGGGASYIMRYFCPKSMIGIDQAKSAITFCNRDYNSPNLLFIPGEAEYLPFKENSFDVIMSIESSHCFSSMLKFLDQANKMLRRDGHLLLADFRIKKQLTDLERALNNSGLKITKAEQINDHIVHALELDNERKIRLIDQIIPRMIRNIFKEFAGTIGKQSTYENLKRRDKVCMNYVLRKF